MLRLRRAASSALKSAGFQSRFGLPRCSEPCLLCAVSKLRVFLKYWLVILLWFGLIFAASSDENSARRSSSIIGPLLHWLSPNMPEETVDHVVLFARKCAHLTATL